MAVAPGAIQTDFSGGMVRDNPALNKQVADMNALGRPGVPEDIGPMIASLLSEDNRWINAQLYGDLAPHLAELGGDISP